MRGSGREESENREEREQREREKEREQRRGRARECTYIQRAETYIVRRVRFPSICCCDPYCTSRLIQDLLSFICIYECIYFYYTV